MDEWSKQFFRSLDMIGQDTERWWQDVTQQLAAASDAFVQATDEWAEQVQQAIDPEVDRIVDEIGRMVEPVESAFDTQLDEIAHQINDVLDPWITTLFGQFGTWVEEVSAPINSTVDPFLQNHPTCVGCRNYYGQAHGGTMLVCAMHPFGPEAEQCADWESFWPSHDDSSGQ